MTTPRELITGALRLINVVQANEVPTAEDMNISFEALNAMLDSWSTEKLSIFSMNPYVFQFRAGQKEYTLGTGGDWDIPRPMDLEMMYVMYLQDGGECPLPPPSPPAAFVNYGSFIVRNGYDGDVGIAGHISESNPFYSPFSVDIGFTQTSPDVDTSYYYLSTVHGETESSRLTAGGGKDTDAPGSVGPMTIGENRQYTNIGNGFFNRYYYLPMQEGDQIWCVDTYFAGYGDVFSVDVVVGPSPTSGEWYNCYGNSTSDYDAVIIIERLAWAGDR